MKKVIARTVVDVNTVHAREGYNSKTGKSTGRISSLVSSRGFPVTALYSTADLGKSITDAKPIAYLESEIAEVEDSK